MLDCFKKCGKQTPYCHDAIRARGWGDAGVIAPAQHPLGAVLFLTTVAKGEHETEEYDPRYTSPRHAGFSKNLS